jgi:hypothetical protein
VRPHLKILYLLIIVAPIFCPIVVFTCPVVEIQILSFGVFQDLYSAKEYYCIRFYLWLEECVQKHREVY